MITEYIGIDLGGTETTRVPAFTNSEATEVTFKAALVSYSANAFFGTLGYADNTGAPITINFGAHGSAVFTGTGFVNEIPGAATNTVGRYPHAAGVGGFYWDSDSTFSMTFSRPMRAIGFYAIDVGDFGGFMTVAFKRAGVTLETFAIHHTASGLGATAVEAGSCMYVGLVSSSAFDEIVFGNSSGGFDVFGFDDFIVQEASQAGLTDAVGPVTCQSALSAEGDCTQCSITFTALVAVAAAAVVTVAVPIVPSTCGHALVAGTCGAQSCT